MEHYKCEAWGQTNANKSDDIVEIYYSNYPSLCE